MNDLQHITAYIFGTMPESEKRDFEQQMAQNETLAQEVKNTKILLLGIDAKGDDELRKQFFDIENKLTKEDFFNTQKTNNEALIPKKAKIISLNPYRWAIAATVLFAVFSLWFLIPPKPQEDMATSPKTDSKTDILTNQETVNTSIEVPKTEPISVPSNSSKTRINPKTIENETAAIRANTTNYYAVVESNYETPNFSTLRSENTDAATEILDSAATLMRKKSLLQALSLLEMQHFAAPFSNKSDVMKAHIFLSTKQYSKSKTAFENIVKANIAPFAEESEYYLLLCYLADYQSNTINYVTLKAKILNDEGHPAFDKVKKIVE